MSADIVDELTHATDHADVLDLVARKNVPVNEFTAQLSAYIARCTRAFPMGEAPRCRDEDDRKYLHCALAGDADYLISRDGDLLAIGRIGSCLIVDPATFLQAMRDAGLAL